MRRAVIGSIARNNCVVLVVSVVSVSLRRLSLSALASAFAELGTAPATVMVSSPSLAPSSSQEPQTSSSQQDRAEQETSLSGVQANTPNNNRSAEAKLLDMNVEVVCIRIVRMSPDHFATEFDVIHSKKLTAYFAPALRELLFRLECQAALGAVAKSSTSYLLKGDVQAFLNIRSAELTIPTITSALRILSHCSSPIVERSGAAEIKLWEKECRNSLPSQWESVIPSHTLSELCGNDNWVERIQKQLFKAIACIASELSFHDSVRLIHVLLLNDTYYLDYVMGTLIDNVEVFLRAVFPTIVAAASPELQKDIVVDLGLLLETVNRQVIAVAGVMSKAVDARISSSKGRHHRIAQLFHTVYHPLANEQFFMLVTNSLATMLRRGAVLDAGADGSHSEVAPSDGLLSNTTTISQFFLLRALSMLPWVNNECINVLLPSLEGMIVKDASAVKGVMLLLGRPEVTVSHIPTVVALLDCFILELKCRGATPAADDDVRGNTNGPRRSALRFIEMSNLPSFLQQIHHVLKVALESLHQRSGAFTEDTATSGSTVDSIVDAVAVREKKSEIQKKSKELYELICSYVLSCISSEEELYQVRLVDTVLHHLVCLAPRVISSHPLTIHLAFALTQVAPTMRFASKASMERIMATTERLQELGIINELYQIEAFQLIKHPLLLKALETTLETKRLAFLRRHGGAQSRGVPPTYIGNSSLAAKNHGIAFVSFRKMMHQWVAEFR